MTKRACLLVLVCTLFCTAPMQVLGQPPVRERLSLDKEWLFHLGDIPFPIITGHRQTYTTSKAGSATGAAAANYDDKEWKRLDLPHDWAVEMPFDSTENISQGYRKRGFGWYRRYFRLNPSDKGKHMELQFDGIATNSTIWVNGIIVHRNWSGYTSSYIDITPLAKYGEEVNVIAVRADAQSHEGWWYEGAGIYRHTWLVKRPPVHIMTDGVFVNPVKKPDGSWIIPAEVTLENSGKMEANVELEMTLYDAKGNTVGNVKSNVSVKPLYSSVASLSLYVNNPMLWSIENPTLYQVKTTVRQNDKVGDEVLTRCGFRTIEFTADSGFYLNGKNVKIQGVCNHQDHAGVGVAVPDALWEFRIRKLKQMGTNAYRCAHHPPAAEFLEACDSLGMMVMDENRNFNTSPEYIRQLEWMVRRDRNHPSIILWSVFNEEPMQGTEQGYEMVRRMSAVVKSLDTTRPVTAAMNGGLFEPLSVAHAVDVIGFNYQMQSYDRFHKAQPEMKMTSSEDVSAFAVRGEYVSDRSKNILNDYDKEKALWGSTHRAGWKAIAERPYLAGGFVWTGFDYRGEPSPFTWPSASSVFGIMDLCGFPKTAYWIHQAHWRKAVDVLQLVPHWNWPKDSIGRHIEVMAISNADSVTLILNSKMAGGQKVDKYEMNSFRIPYQPGKLEAIGYKNGKQVSRFKMETTGVPVSLLLIPDHKTLKNDGWDAMPITVQALDSKGRPVPTANLPVTFEISGGGKIIGLGNGDPNSHEPEKGKSRSLFNGLAQVVVQSMEGAKGRITLMAKSQGLKNAVALINLNEVFPVPSIEVYRPAMVLDQWRVSPVSLVRPDPNQKLEESDMNSWLPVKPGQLQDFANGRFIVFRTTFRPDGQQQKNGGVIVFKNLTGKAEAWMDGQQIGTKADAAPADWTLTFPAAKGERVLSVLIEAEGGKKAGLGGVVIAK